MIIYKTTNLINGKIYIGQDSHNNPNYYGSGEILKKAIKKYGKENFKKEILEECHSKQELNQKEKYWIKTLDSSNRKLGYNLTIGGGGGDTFTNNPNFGKKAPRYECKCRHRMFSKSKLNRYHNDNCKLNKGE